MLLQKNFVPQVRETFLCHRTTDRRLRIRGYNHAGNIRFFPSDFSFKASHTQVSINVLTFTIREYTSVLLLKHFCDRIIPQ